LNPDLAIITVKAYDTQNLIDCTQPILKRAKHILTLQNGLGNIETITCIIPPKRTLAGITTHGAIFTKPGTIKHTGIGRTIIGPITPISPDVSHHIAQAFTTAGIPTIVSQDIQKDIWKKAVINSAINPLTTIFHCKNGYLLENPILETILDRITNESTTITNTQNYQLNSKDMITQTKHVIHETTDNYSSMLQSIQQHQPTEIDYINGALKTIGQHHKIPTPLNTLITNIIHTLSNET
jgi:2-dehydropantoate 2-reductase